MAGGFLRSAVVWVGMPGFLGLPEPFGDPEFEVDQGGNAGPRSLFYRSSYELVRFLITRDADVSLNSVDLWRSSFVNQHVSDHLMDDLG